MNKSHGLSNHRLYKIYKGVRDRCFNKKRDYYKKYGGRGITMCSEWLNDFLSFYNWSINNGYDDNLTLDRIDNNGNYEPYNCRWATYKTQANNHSLNTIVEYNGDKIPFMLACELLKVNDVTIRKRMKDRNLSFEDATINYKKEYNKGSNVIHSKLSKEQVQLIRKLYVPRKFPTRKLAKMFNVSQAAIFYIINNKNWKI